MKGRVYEYMSEGRLITELLMNQTTTVPRIRIMTSSQADGIS